MTQLKVKELVRIISEEGDSPGYFYKHLDFCPRNEHLRNPLNKAQLSDYFKPRQAAHMLTGEEIVYGDYLVYDCTGHNGTELVVQFQNLEEVEACILSSGGYLNPFTTNLVAIVFGKKKEFKVKTKTQNGDVIEFIKRENEELFEKAKMIWVEWEK